MGHPIYYMTGRVAFIKGKNLQRKDVWIVSRYDNPEDIMRHDHKTMYRLDKELLTAKANKRSIIIESVNNIKEVGTTSYGEEAKRETDWR